MIIPPLTEVVNQNPTLQFVVAAVDNLANDYYKELNGLPNVKFIYAGTYDLLSFSDAAIVTSGTATLETALFKVSQVVVYKTSLVSYWIARSLIRVPFISLVNLIAGREVVKEMIQQRANGNEVSAELNHLKDKQYRDRY